MRTSSCYGLIIFIALLVNVTTKIHITSIVCRSLDKTFSDFEYCYLKAVNRSYKYVSLKVNLFKLPVDNVSVRFEFKKRANGYKTFLYDVTIDACEFLRKKNNPVVKYFYSFFETSSNMNHTCPYNHDLIVHQVGTDQIENQMVTLLPFPDGDYALWMTWYAYNKARATVNTFATLQ